MGGATDNFYRLLLATKSNVGEEVENRGNDGSNKREVRKIIVLEQKPVYSN